MASHGSLGQGQEPPGQAQELRPERLVVEIRHEWVHDRAADGSGEHGGRHPGVGPASSPMSMRDSRSITVRNGS